MQKGEKMNKESKRLFDDLSAAIFTGRYGGRMKTTRLSFEALEKSLEVPWWKKVGEWIKEKAQWQKGG